MLHVILHPGDKHFLGALLPAQLALHWLQLGHLDQMSTANVVHNPLLD